MPCFVLFDWDCLVLCGLWPRGDSHKLSRIAVSAILVITPGSSQEAGLVEQLLISEHHKALPSSGSLGNIHILWGKRKEERQHLMLTC